MRKGAGIVKETARKIGVFVMKKGLHIIAVISMALFLLCVGHAELAGFDLDGFQPKRTVKVDSLEALRTAIDEAQRGDLIEVADGDYTNMEVLSIQIQATAENPVVIRAENIGEAWIYGEAGMVMDNCRYVAVVGFRFRHLDKTSAMGINACQHCRFSRNSISLEEQEGEHHAHYLTVGGNHSRANRVDHNEFAYKSSRGVMVATGGADVELNNQSTQYDRIDHNYFHDFEKGDRNGFETIRLGLSTYSHSYGYITVDNNLFVRCSGEGEIISVKCNGNMLKNNTFIDCFGMLTLRNCHECTCDGNMFFNPEGNEGRYGIRLYGQDHRIINNYMQNLTSPAIIIRACDIERRTKPRYKYGEDEEWGAYQRIERAIVAHNTIVNCRVAFQIGDESEDRPLAPRDCTIANNIIVSDQKKINQLRSQPENWTWLNNIVSASAEDASFVLDIPESGLIWTAPEFIRGGRVWKLSAKSPAINASAPLSIDVERDFEQQQRLDTPDIGADEFSFSQPTGGPLTPDDVGVEAE